jgi:hypothetical protein
LIVSKLVVLTKLHHVGSRLLPVTPTYWKDVVRLLHHRPLGLLHVVLVNRLVIQESWDVVHNIEGEILVLKVVGLSLALVDRSRDSRGVLVTQLFGDALIASLLGLQDVVSHFLWVLVLLEVLEDV